MAPIGFARNETGFIKYTSKEEFFTLLKGLKKYDFKFRLMFLFMFYLGLRRKEVCKLKWVDLTPNYDRIRITDVKNHEVRERVIPEKLKQEIVTYEFTLRHSLKDEKGLYMFKPSWQSRSKYPHIQPNSVTAKFKQARDKMGLKDYYYVKKGKRKDKLYRLSPHTLRHFFITEIYEKSDLITTQRIIGHRKAETTARYIYKNNLKDKEKELVNEL